MGRSPLVSLATSARPFSVVDSCLTNLVPLFHLASPHFLPLQLRYRLLVIHTRFSRFTGCADICHALFIAIVHPDEALGGVLQLVREKNLSTSLADRSYHSCPSISLPPPGLPGPHHTKLGRTCRAT